MSTQKAVQALTASITSVDEIMTGIRDHIRRLEAMRKVVSGTVEEAVGTRTPAIEAAMLKLTIVYELQQSCYAHLSELTVVLSELHRRLRQI